MKDRIFDFDAQLNELNNQIKQLETEAETSGEAVHNTRKEINDILAMMNTMPGVLRPVSETIEIPEIEQLAVTIKELSDDSLPGAIHLTSLDIIVSVISGVIASVIDIVFVGTPEIVKLYKTGKENFDGSILTALLRKIGANEKSSLSKLFKWLSDKCKTPYDISVLKDVVYPNNHRLRSFAHDPLIGLLFAVADIILGTATLIDNDGKIRIVINDKNHSQIEKYLAVLYYLGHLISDVCTARGLPIPGFILTQLFAKGEKSIARIAEAMYKDGYDLRHLASLSTPVFIKNLIIDGYIHLTQDNQTDIPTIAQKEIAVNRQTAYRYSLRLISDAVCCGGNILKFFIPPTSGNPTALNLPEWAKLITDTIVVMKYQLRDKSIERVINNRDIINDNWIKLAIKKDDLF